ncbi:MAG: hypothetical protein JWQ74_2622 [Marmoricola sp.]|nr:hypothetical protein [Marmoricola sp.]
MKVLRVLVLVCLAVLLAGPASAAIKPLPLGTDFDYQLGGNRPVPAGVGIVERDRSARPLPGRYNICYINGFQTQSDELRFWKKHPHLILRRHGRPVIDEGWGEQLLDTRTSAKRARLAAIEGHWITGCKAHGYDAVEFDNLDSFSRSHGLISRKDNQKMAKLLVDRSHRAGLAAGQKNWAEWNGRTVGYDFAIAEECGRYDECGEYVSHYGDRVLVIEYREVDFKKTCQAWGDRLAVVLRDVDLSPTGVRRWC